MNGSTVAAVESENHPHSRLRANASGVEKRS